MDERSHLIPELGAGLDSGQIETPADSEKAGTARGSEKEQGSKAEAEEGGRSPTKTALTRARKRVTITKAGPCYACFYCGRTPNGGQLFPADPDFCWYYARYNTHRYEQVPCGWCRRVQHPVYTKCPGATHWVTDEEAELDLTGVDFGSNNQTGDCAGDAGC